MSDKQIESASRQLLDECERIFFQDLEENKFLPHLFKAINNMRLELGIKKLVLTTVDES